MHFSWNSWHFVNTFGLYTEEFTLRIFDGAKIEYMWKILLSFDSFDWCSMHCWCISKKRNKCPIKIWIWMIWKWHAIANIKRNKILTKDGDWKFILKGRSLIIHFEFMLMAFKLNTLHQRLYSIPRNIVDGNKIR